MKQAALLTVGMSAMLITAAAAAPLDVSPGLWEVISQSETSGLPPIPPQALAQMSPQQRAQMMAAMQGHAGQPDVTRSCVTQKMLDRGMSFDRKGSDRCTQTVVGSTSRSLDLRFVCTSERQQNVNGTMHVDATSRETFTGSFKLVSSNGTNTMTMKRMMQGRWLGSDCGDVKPHDE
jgi:hypothetical protein